MAEKIAVIGAGSWGTAISLVLAENNPEVFLWVHEADLCQLIKEKRENTRFLPGFILPENIIPSHCLSEAADAASVIVFVVPAQHLRKITTAASSIINPNTLIISASKGIEIDTLKTASQIIHDTIPAYNKEKIAVLSGPNFAKEISLKLPSASTIACFDRNTARMVRSLFVSPWFKIFINDDPIGVELGGALKNVIAIAAGISDGLGYGNSTRAALITRGLVEISRLGEAMGAQAETFLGLSGVGDLVLTCTGDLSRNRTVGLSLAEGRKIKDIETEMNMVAEGVYTVKSAYLLGKKYNVRMSIIDEVYEVIYNEKDIKKAIADLLATDIVDEF